MFSRRILSGIFLFLFLTYLHFEATCAHPLAMDGVPQSSSLGSNKKTGRKPGRSVVQPKDQLPIISIQADDAPAEKGASLYSSVLDSLEIGVNKKVHSRSSRSSKSCTEKVKGIIAEQLDVERSHIVSDASIVDDLGADSLSFVELILAAEEAFGVDIPDEDAEKIKTVGDLIRYVCH